MKGFAIILGFNLIGLALQGWAHFPIPSGVTGLILLSAALFAGWIKLEWVEQSAQFLIDHLLLFFAPVIVGTLALAAVIGQHWAPIVCSMVGSTFLVMLVTGWTTRLLERRGEQTNESP